MKSRILHPSEIQAVVSRYIDDNYWLIAEPFEVNALLITFNPDVYPDLLFVYLSRLPRPM